MPRTRAHLAILVDGGDTMTFPLRKYRDWLYVIDFLRDAGYEIDELDAYSVEAVLP